MNKVCSDGTLTQFFSGKVKYSCVQKICDFLTCYELVRLREVSKLFRDKIDISSQALAREGISTEFNYKNKSGIFVYRSYVRGYCYYFYTLAARESQKFRQGFSLNYNFKKMDIFDAEKSVNEALSKKHVSFATNLLEEELRKGNLKNAAILVNAKDKCSQTILKKSRLERAEGVWDKVMGFLDHVTRFM